MMEWHLVIFLCGTSFVFMAEAEAAANEVNQSASDYYYTGLVQPCVDDLVAALIHEPDVDGHILYKVNFHIRPHRNK